jgi:hypothetical protein
VSERAPLSAVSSVELNENGETLLMGRSSNSSHYQLSANRLISRIHVKARFVQASQPSEPNKVEIICNGWNGLKLHCQGRTWDLSKGDTFTSETEGAEIMIDVQDARVLMQWPRKDKEREPLGNLSDSSWDDSPRSRAGGSLLQGSPLRRTARIASPESPTPANVPNGALHDLLPDTSDQGATVQIYEDNSSDEQELPKLAGAADALGTSQATVAANSFSSELSDLHSDDENDPENDPDEENDPIVHSFGPFGANLSNRLASFTTTSPKMPRVSRLSSSESTAVALGTVTDIIRSPKSNSLHTSPKAPAAFQPTLPPLSLIARATISNHVVNQLAYSRLASNPLSGIMANLPAEEKKDLTKDTLRAIIESTACIGVIPREGKDAAGKPLESEYYYVPEFDTDEHRRLAVTDGLRKPSLRNCRKQHKVNTHAYAPAQSHPHPHTPVSMALNLVLFLLTQSIAILLEAATDAVSSHALRHIVKVLPYLPRYTVDLIPKNARSGNENSQT